MTNCDRCHKELPATALQVIGVEQVCADCAAEIRATGDFVTFIEEEDN